MNITSARQIYISDINDLEIDAAIFATGYERRARYLAETISGFKIKSKIAFGFKDRKVLSRKINDERFKKLGYDLREAEGDDQTAIVELLHGILLSLVGKKEIRILVDYSCMTRVWYSSIVSFLSSDIFPIGKIEILFSYTPAKYANPNATVPNEQMGPIPGFSSIELPEKKIALIVGLGYERDRALGLLDYVDPAEAVAFYAHPCIDERFNDVVLKNNHQFLSRIPPENVYQFPINDLRTSEILLSAICRSMSREFRVIVAPLGPKPFSLISLLISCKYGGIDLWRVSSGTQGRPYDFEAACEPIICSVQFST